MRSPPQSSHYEIVTDGNGNVFILPPAADLKLTMPATLTALAANPNTETDTQVSTLLEQTAHSSTSMPHKRFITCLPCADSGLVQ